LIVLNNNKELIEVEHWDDIVDRPGFTNNLNPKFHKLEAIIGKYHFREKIPCGLSNCHTLHAKGYIVVTTDGTETNMGNVCGKKFFGIDFDTLSAAFNRDLTEQKYREKLWTFSSKLGGIKYKISEIREQPNGVKWVFSMTEQLLNSSECVPDETSELIKTMVKEGGTVLYTSREATAKEVELFEASQNRKIPLPHYIREPLAEIAGLNALLPENNLRNLVIFQLDEKIKKFESESIDSMSLKTLSEWVKWADRVPDTLKRAIKSLKSGQLLLTRENLTPFSQLLLATAQKAKFQKFLKELPSMKQSA
jgi:hypothetical protein